ncbi:unknown [Bacteroides sp. CAG:20]|nr:unknown [Bacteroides sp. CAG:20]
MYNICKNIVQQTIRFSTSVLDNINLNINILYSNF